MTVLLMICLLLNHKNLKKTLEINLVNIKVLLAYEYKQKVELSTIYHTYTNTVFQAFYNYIKVLVYTKTTRKHMCIVVTHVNTMS